VVGVAFAEGGKRAVSCGRDGTVRLWDADTGNEVRRFASSAECLVVPPDGRRVLLGENRLVRLLDVANGKVLHRFDGHKDQVTALAISGDGRHALSGGADGTVWLWGLPP
jgi:WD40 repeat protein